jgi:hypothetical protein
MAIRGKRRSGRANVMAIDRKNWWMLAAAATALVAPAQAQQAAPKASDKEEEVVVFAQKREQRVQDISTQSPIWASWARHASSGRHCASATKAHR